MIIAFTGKKQSGKSTACSYIESKVPGVVRVNFKDALIDEIKENFPQLLNAIVETMDKTEYDGVNPWSIDRLFKDKPPLMRALMQNYGTDVRRSDIQSYWTDQWIRKVISTGYKTVLCDDVRFINEEEAVRSLGGIVVRIVREDLPHTDTHASETEQDTILADYTISVKTGEHQKLYAFLDQILEAKQSTPNGLLAISSQWDTTN